MQDGETKQDAKNGEQKKPQTYAEFVALFEKMGYTVERFQKESSAVFSFTLWNHDPQDNSKSGGWTL